MSVGDGQDTQPGGGPLEPTRESLDLSGDLPPGLMPNISGQCLRKIAEYLECHTEHGKDRDPQLVCAPRASEEGGISIKSLHAIFLTVIVTTVLLTVVLNLAVIVTIAVNRRLHTLVNYLVSCHCSAQTSSSGSRFQSSSPV